MKSGQSVVTRLIPIGEQYYYTKVLSFTAIDGMSINVQARLRSQGWLDSVTVY